MLLNGTAEFTPQDNEASTHTAMIHKELGEIDWNKSAVEIERLIRGLNPWPSAYTHLNGKTFKIWQAKVLDENSDKEPGNISKINKNDFCVQTGDGQLILKEVQLEGKKRMDIWNTLDNAIRYHSVYRAPEELNEREECS